MDYDIKMPLPFQTPRVFDPLAGYLQHGMHRVAGWLAPTSATMIAHLGLLQVTAGLRGDTCEIGVHHGKLFLVLANCTTADEVAVAVDVFSDQEKNIDRSGLGDRALFEKNVRDYAPLARVEIIQESSLDLEAIGFKSRRFRLFSIDGGHTAKATENDLGLAQSCAVKGGVVLIDDLLSSHWLGVMTGVSSFLAHGGTLMPFAMSHNKLYLTTDVDSAERYRTEFRNVFSLALEKKEVEFFGTHIDAYGEHPYFNLSENFGLRQEITDLKRELNEVRHLFQAADSENFGLRQEITDLKQELNEVRHLFQAADSENFGLRQEIVDLKQELNDVRYLSETTESENTALLQELADQKQNFHRLQSARAELEAMLASTSWRAMAPARWIANTFVKRG